MPQKNQQNRRFGYARVSTCGQALDAQLEQLRKADCPEIYQEKVTGVRLDQRELFKLLKTPCSGDVLPATRIDRFALRPLCHRQTDRRRGQAIPLIGQACGLRPRSAPGG